MFNEFNWIEATGGSPIFLVLVGCSIVAFAVAIERAWYFWKRSSNPDQTLNAVLAGIKSGKIDEAIWTCKQSKHPMGKVAASVFRIGRREGESYEEQMQVALSQEKLLLERNLSMLGTLAAIAPLIGLLGTVWGIMRAFHDMAATGSAAPTVVAAGVAEALITTAAGLIIAVPALVLYNHFSSRLNVMLTVAENSARTIHGVLSRGENPERRSTGTDGLQADEMTTAAGSANTSPEPAVTR